MFNHDHPPLFTDRPISVGDIVIIGPCAYYCDSMEWRPVTVQYTPPIRDVLDGQAIEWQDFTTGNVRRSPTLDQFHQAVPSHIPGFSDLDALATRILCGGYRPSHHLTARPTVYGLSPLAPRQRYSLADHQTIAARLARWIWAQGWFPVLPHLYLPHVLDDQDPVQRAEAVDILPMAKARGIHSKTRAARAAEATDPHS